MNMIDNGQPINMQSGSRTSLIEARFSILALELPVKEAVVATESTRY
jgi:hypothetical protein